MEWWYHIPIVTCVAWVFALGLGIGSFLNVLIARMPFEKSVIWPGSRCGACYRSLRLIDNLPIIGYLRLRGKCRFCGTTFSSRYLWVELATGLVFVGLFLLEVVFNWHHIPGLATPAGAIAQFPPLSAWFYFGALAFLFSLMIAASVIDLQYKIIPLQLTYVGTLVGILVSTLLPWPWPSDLAAVPPPPADYGWTNFQLANKIPTGLALWPVWGPPPAWAPAGSWQLGLFTGLMGAAVGQAIGRSAKWLFEIGFQQEALGLGDADLMMMMGSFFGWQITVLALPAGAFVLLPILIPWLIVTGLRKRRQPQIPFGPGIAAGAVACWLIWPALGEASRFVFFEPIILVLCFVIVGGGLLISGLFLRRGPAVEPAGTGTTP